MLISQSKLVIDPTHIDTMLLSASRLIGIMRKLKYSVRSKTMNHMYILFLRPILE